MKNKLERLNILHHTRTGNISEMNELILKIGKLGKAA